MKTADRSSRRIDYDQIASSYKQRYEASHMDGVLSTLQTLARGLEAERIVEVGSGGALAVVGSDPQGRREEWVRLRLFRWDV
jgi:hypothetical protein